MRLSLLGAPGTVAPRMAVVLIELTFDHAVVQLSAAIRPYADGVFKAFVGSNDPQTNAELQTAVGEKIVRQGLMDGFNFLFIAHAFPVRRIPQNQATPEFGEFNQSLPEICLASRLES